MNPLACPRCGVGAVPAGTSPEDLAPGVEWWCDHCRRVWTLTVRGPHQPDRPGWSCTADGEPWPCRATRAQLPTQFAGDPDRVRRYLAALRVEAARDRPDLPAHVLTARFALTR